MELSSELLDYLRQNGFSEKSISLMNPKTRLYHDLDYDGDTAEEMINLLSDNYGVDLTGFEFDLYFPREFPGKRKITRLIVSSIPFGRFFYNRQINYLPLTLSMIEEAIKSKRWQNS